MFGLIVAGRLVETQTQQVDVNKCLFPPMASLNAVNHVVVFLTGAQPFPEGYGGAVYLSWNGMWQYLGMLSNEKPSAIFKVTSARPKAEHIVSNPFGAMGESAMGALTGDVAQIGISVEPLHELTSLPSVGQSAASNPTNFIAFTEAMLKNFVNYAMSFAFTREQVLQRPHEQYVPLSIVHHWFDNFKRKLQLNPDFWKNEPRD